MIESYLVGGDRIGWALDVELELTRRCLPESIHASNPFRSQVVHAISWTALRNFPRELIAGRRVMSHLTHAPEAAISQAGFEHVENFVQLWVVRSKPAKREFDQRGLQNILIPYAYDPGVFFRIPKDHPSLNLLRSQWHIPAGHYLIGSFQRDTEGVDLLSPKLVKGPDIFLDIVRLVNERVPNIHVLLAGPRRFWLRQKLTEHRIPYTFIGRETRADDLRINILTQETINLLYNLLDVYLVTSRLEGGPQAVLEASATECKILSTPVGHASDILDQDCIIRSPEDAVEKILADIAGGNLASTLPHNRNTVQRASPDAVRPLWEEAYAQLMTFEALAIQDLKFQPNLWKALLMRVRGR